MEKIKAFDLKKEILLAEERIRPYIRETLMDYALGLSLLTKADVHLKCENLQITSAFKTRGAMNKLLSLTDEERNRGIVAASSGNHGAAIAYGCKKLGIKGRVFVPENASSTKVDNIRRYEIPLEFYGDDMMLTEVRAIEYAKQHHQVYISPYNDPQVIGGQGTIGLEILKQLPKVDAVFVPVGGGGLISGIAGYIKAFSPQTQMIGCLPQNSPVMAECIKAGKIIEMKTLPTISDATAGGLEPGAITFEICQKLIDDFILVSEEEIYAALITIIKTQHLLIEGAAAVAVASLIKNAEHFANKTVVIVLSGANISIPILKKVLD